MTWLLADVMARRSPAGCTWPRRAFALTVAVLFWVATGPGAVLMAQLPQHCDLVLDSDVRHPFGYRQRGQRCEGIYVKSVAASPLLLRSLTRAFVEIKESNTQPIRIAWFALEGSNSELRLQAHALRRRLYYRMDTARPMGDGEFFWPGDLLSALHLTRGDLGLTGAAEIRIGDALRKVYLPIALSRKNGVPARAHCELVLWPGVELRELFMTITRLSANGSDAVRLKEQSPLGYGYYPAERPIRIQQPEICTPGVYRVEIGALHRGSGSSTLEFWVASAGG